MDARTMRAVLLIHGHRMCCHPNADPSLPPNGMSSGLYGDWCTKPSMLHGKTASSMASQTRMSTWQCTCLTLEVHLLCCSSRKKAGLVILMDAKDAVRRVSSLQTRASPNMASTNYFPMCTCNRANHARSPEMQVLLLSSQASADADAHLDLDHAPI